MSNYGDHNLLNSLQVIRNYCSKINGRIAEINTISKTLKPNIPKSIFSDVKRAIFTILSISMFLILIIFSLSYTGVLLKFVIPVYTLVVFYKYLKNPTKNIKKKLIVLSIISLISMMEFIIILIFIFVITAVITLIIDKTIGPSLVEKYNNNLYDKQLDRVNQINNLNIEKNKLVNELREVTGSWYPSDWNIYLDIGVLDFFINSVQNKKAYTIQELVQLLDTENYRNKRLANDRERISLQASYNNEFIAHNKQVEKELRRQTGAINEQARRQSEDIKRANDNTASAISNMHNSMLNK